jgi:hypothetical protein
MDGNLKNMAKDQISDSEELMIPAILLAAGIVSCSSVANAAEVSPVDRTQGWEVLDHVSDDDLGRYLGTEFTEISGSSDLIGPAIDSSFSDYSSLSSLVPRATAFIARRTEGTATRQTPLCIEIASDAYSSGLPGWAADTLRSSATPEASSLIACYDNGMNLKISTGSGSSAVFSASGRVINSQIPVAGSNISLSGSRKWDVGSELLREFSSSIHDFSGSDSETLTDYNAAFADGYNQIPTAVIETSKAVALDEAVSADGLATYKNELQVFVDAHPRSEGSVSAYDVSSVVNPEDTGLPSSAEIQGLIFAIYSSPEAVTGHNDPIVSSMLDKAVEDVAASGSTVQTGAMYSASFDGGSFSNNFLLSPIVSNDYLGQ